MNKEIAHHMLNIKIGNMIRNVNVEPTGAYLKFKNKRVPIYRSNDIPPGVYEVI